MSPWFAFDPELIMTNLAGYELVLVPSGHETDSPHLKILKHATSAHEYSVVLVSLRDIHSSDITVTSKWKPWGVAPWRKLRLWTKNVDAFCSVNLVAKLSDLFAMESVDNFSEIEALLLDLCGRPLLIVYYAELGNEGVWRSALHESYVETSK